MFSHWGLQRRRVFSTDWPRRECKRLFLPVLPIRHRLNVWTTDETAAVALFLASHDNSFMTGSEVFVDGGLAGLIQRVRSLRHGSPLEIANP
jgi:NAD(P)-dependent dehydrogenase (short-subunit alcohol dehydrogenase family)